jgi:amicyanin
MKKSLTPSITAACLLLVGTAAWAQGPYGYGYGYGYPGAAYPAPAQRPQGYPAYPGYRQPARPQIQDSAPASDQAATAKGHRIDISGMRFSPAVLKVKAGDQVTWAQRDSMPHRLISSDGESVDSPTLGRGQQYSQRFDEPGTYEYVCSIHPSMRGTVEVE